MLKDNVEKIRALIPPSVRLVIVSKFRTESQILELYKLGERDFGENRVQELVSKQQNLPADIRWHMIGTLQRNKVKYIVPFIHLIHSIDSVSLLQEVNSQAGKVNRVVDVLLEVFIANEETKHGFSPEEAKDFLNSDFQSLFPKIRICGLMGMASNTADMNKVRSEFLTLKKLFDDCNLKFQGNKTLSMGMSNDFPIAVNQGSNLVRIGSAIFN